MKKNLIEQTIANHTLQVKKLIEQGANVNMTDDSGFTSLHYASREGNVEIVRLLLQKGANTNNQNKIGFTALHYAVMNGNIDIASLLLKKGAMTDIENVLGYTPLYYVYRERNSKMLDLFEEKESTQLIHEKRKAHEFSQYLDEAYRKKSMIRKSKQQSQEHVLHKQKGKEKDGSRLKKQQLSPEQTKKKKVLEHVVKPKGLHKDLFLELYQLLGGSIRDEKRMEKKLRKRANE